MSIPFSIYDTFGYLAAGLIVMAAVEFGFDCNWLIERRDWNYGTIGAVLLIAYLIGHIVAHLSSFFIEHQFVRKVLSPPEELMLRDNDSKIAKWCQRIFPMFHRALPEETRKRILETAAASGIAKPGRALFLHGFALVKQEKNMLDRFNTFVVMYGFARNMCAALCIAFVVFCISAIWQGLVGGSRELNWAKVGFAILAVLGAVGMFYRYLKFYHHCTQEILITFPEIKKPTEKGKE